MYQYNDDGWPFRSLLVRLRIEVNSAVPTILYLQCKYRMAAPAKVNTQLHRNYTLLNCCSVRNDLFPLFHLLFI